MHRLAMKIQRSMTDANSNPSASRGPCGGPGEIPTMLLLVRNPFGYQIDRQESSA